jgi:hypothetical protein
MNAPGVEGEGPAAAEVAERRNDQREHHDPEQHGGGDHGRDGDERADTAHLHHICRGGLKGTDLPLERGLGRKPDSGDACSSG